MDRHTFPDDRRKVAGTLRVPSAGRRRDDGHGLRSFSQPPSRPGVTILEVLFSMGVIAVGLLGVMAIVPVALNQVGRGEVSDRSARAGLNALREFEARGMARADQWLYFHPQGRWDVVTWSKGLDIRPNAPPVSVWGTAADDDGFGATMDAFGSFGPDNVAEAGWRLAPAVPISVADQRISTPVPGVSFAIDPRFLASVTMPPAVSSPRLNSSRPGNPTAAEPNGNEFPYRRIVTVADEPPLLKMQRVSLRSFPATGTDNMLPMGRAQADKVFLLDDDLVFDIPPEVEDSPQQVYVWMPGPDNAWGQSGLDDDGVNGVDDAGEQGWPGSDDLPILRQFEGEYSWMATMVPKRDQLGDISDRYILSIVVFHRRDPFLEMNAVNERVAYIPATSFHAFGFSGGDVTLHAYRSAPSQTAELEVRAGDWVVLAAPLVHAARRSFPYFRWYRVASAAAPEELPPGSGRIVRDVTLEGPDWPLDAIVPHPTIAAQPDHTRVVLVSSVVAVYERTILIETN